MCASSRISNAKVNKNLQLSEKMKNLFVTYKCSGKCMNLTLTVFIEARHELQRDSRIFLSSL